jgi:hypothetical protein
MRHTITCGIIFLWTFFVGIIDSRCFMYWIMLHSNWSIVKCPYLFGIFEDCWRRLYLLNFFLFWKVLNRTALHVTMKCFFLNFLIWSDKLDVSEGADDDSIPRTWTARNFDLSPRHLSWLSEIYNNMWRTKGSFNWCSRQIRTHGKVSSWFYELKNLIINYNDLILQCATMDLWMACQHAELGRPWTIDMKRKYFLLAS